MPQPSDPDKTITVGNTRTTTGELYEYYISNKDKILKECNYRKVLLFNKYDTHDTFTVVRKYKESAIILNKDNYEDIISGYTVSLSVESEYPGQTLRQKIIDIDSRSDKITEKDLKKCVTDLFHLYNRYKCYVTISSTGYHFRVDINSQSYKQALAITKNELMSKFQGIYAINEKPSTRNAGMINLDLVAMQSRGSLTVPYALNRNLTICRYIQLKDLNNARRSTEKFT